MIKQVLITGANAGLGKEAARQLANTQGIEKIYLACRSKERALAAKSELEKMTGKKLFQIVLMDMTDQASIKNAVSSLNKPLDALIMNAGGAGGKAFHKKNQDGVTQQFAVNLLGHAVLAEELIKAKKLTQVAIYAGSEAARGVKEMGMKAPDLKTSSANEFASICDGEFFGHITDSQISYGPIKYMGALWMSSMARRHTDIRFVTMSPGGTKGTNALNSLPFFKKLMFQGMLQLMSLFGKVHTADVGAKRFVDALLDTSYQSGRFYGSKKGISGPIIDQASLFTPLNNQAFQDNAYQAIQRFVSLNNTKTSQIS